MCSRDRETAIEFISYLAQVSLAPAFISPLITSKEYFEATVGFRIDIEYAKLVNMCGGISGAKLEFYRTAGRLLVLGSNQRRDPDLNFHLLRQLH